MLQAKLLSMGEKCHELEDRCERLVKLNIRMQERLNEGLYWNYHYYHFLLSNAGGDS